MKRPDIEQVRRRINPAAKESISHLNEAYLCIELLADYVEHLESQQQTEEFILRAGDFDPSIHETQVSLGTGATEWRSDGRHISGKHADHRIVVRTKKKPRYYATSFVHEMYHAVVVCPSDPDFHPVLTYTLGDAQLHADRLNHQETTKDL